MRETTRQNIDRISRLTKITKVTQYIAFVLTFIAAAVPLVSLAAAACFAVSFWVNTKREALKEADDRRREERMVLEHYAALQQMEEKLKREVSDGLGRDRRLREEVHHRLYGNLILR
jgi:hypothetical protein